MARIRNKNGLVAAVLVAVVGGMVGLSFASVPLYRLFCQITGFGGTPNIVAASSAEKAASDRTIAVRFDANVNPALPWTFQPDKLEIQVRLGEPTLAFYQAVNQSGHAVTGTATFNVTPYKAGIYFSKIECFCFTEQRLAAHTSAEMPVQFVVDPEIFKDPNTKDVTAITLSYTFFPAETGDAKGKTIRCNGTGPPNEGLIRERQGSDRRNG
jgi:cytochrome c oxidase assembly protein subunit 11